MGGDKILSTTVKLKTGSAMIGFSMIGVGWKGGGTLKNTHHCIIIHNPQSSVLNPQSSVLKFLSSNRSFCTTASATVCNHCLQEF